MLPRCGAVAALPSAADPDPVQGRQECVNGRAQMAAGALQPVVHAGGDPGGRALVSAPVPHVGVHDVDRPEEQPVDPVAVPGRQDQPPRTASELEATRVARVGLARAEVAEDLRRAGSFHRE